jgi:tetratricopeptide (TPR) repeat protein
VITLALALLFATSPRALTTQDPRAEILARDFGVLPRARAERWREWRPTDAIPAELASSMGAALTAYRDADYARSLSELERVLRAEADFPPALYQLGATYFRLRRYGDGARAFERFLAAAPHEVGATQGLAHCYYSLGDYARAQAHYAKVLEVAPGSVEAWRGLGLAQLRQGDSATALASLDRSLALRPDYADALAWRAQALVDLGRTGEAFVPLRRALELAPHDARSWFLLAQLESELGREDAAESARARFAELSRIEQEVRAQEGLLLYEPCAVEPLSKLVLLHSAARNKSELREVGTRLLRCAPERLDVRVQLLDAATTLADLELAARVAAELEARFSESVGAWEALERYFRASGDVGRADAAREKSRSR